MKVLVTGGAGFIGSHIVDRLVQLDAQVYVLDNLSTGSRNNVHPKATFIKKDIRDKKITELFLQEQFDYVVHQAAQTTVPGSLDDPRYDCDVNVMGLVNLLEASRLSTVKRIVFASSAAVYGDVKTVPIDELDEKLPTSFYGLSKLTEEHYLAMYYKNFGLEYVALRYANVYGERQGDSGEGGVISIFAKKILAGEPLRVYGDGTQTRDFIYVRDVAEANIHALFTQNANRSYNISTGTETSVNELIKIMCKKVGRIPGVEHAAPRENDIYRSALKNDAATQFLQWKVAYSINAGLQSTLREMERNKLCTEKRGRVQDSQDRNRRGALKCVYFP